MIVLFSVSFSVCAAGHSKNSLIGGWSSSGKVGPVDLGFFEDGTVVYGDYIGTYSIKGTSVEFDLLLGGNLGGPREFFVTDELLTLVFILPNKRPLIKNYVRVAR